MSHPTQSLSVHFGCGIVTPEGWENFDASPTLRLSKIPGLGKLLKLPSWPARARCGDVVKGLPVPPGSCKRLFSHNMLEHLSLEDAHTTLTNCRRLLAPDGVFRLFIPDMYCHVQTYLSLRESRPAQAAPTFIELMDMGTRKRDRGLKGLLKGWLGNSRHLWMWDEAALAAALEEAGFSRIKRVRYLDSGDPMFDMLEVQHPEWAEYVLGMESRC
jgi:Methyltransferase domain